VEAGADLLELGVPFSDPIAEGPTIQRASQRALDNGTTLDHCLAAVAELRAGVSAGLLLMGYANPFARRGLGRCVDALSAAGGDGLIVVDLPPEMSGDLASACRARDLDLITLAAPTTPLARMRVIGSGATGFVYCVSLTGVTGARTQLDRSLPEFLGRVRTVTALPRVVGFGIAQPEHVQALRLHAEGVIVGSALIDIVERSEPGQAISDAAGHLQKLRAATARDPDR
ncbi:MAG: tryptophan synthase subunit alpha, partial [Actinobacteria bacterium]|nr:tryptophan synthase subunit alpha [Actinomycetota bacterium]